MGDRVVIVAPSSPVGDPVALRRGTKLLATRYRVTVPATVFARNGLFAGADRTRLRTLGNAIEDPKTRAIFTARGGHGATRLLSGMGWEGWYADRIPLVGFSDVTAIHMAALALAGVATVHGPSVTSISSQPRGYVDHLFRLLEEPGYDFGPPPARLWSLQQGRAVGNLVGGNLTIIDQLVGTPYLPDLAGCILVLEDVNEAPYRIDRMLTHLRNAGTIDRIAGLVMGSFHRCRPRTDGVTVDQVVQDHLASLRVPALAGMPLGHGRRNWAFVQGARVELRCQEKGRSATLAAAPH